MLALVLVGAGLRSGLLTGPAPFALTVVPAAFGAGVIAVALATSLLPRDLDRRVRARPARHERLAGIVASAASAAGAIAAGIRGALALLRGRDPALIGAIAWWGFDIGVLWACFHAFGEPPPPAVLVMAYFTGMLGNLLRCQGRRRGGRHDRRPDRLRRGGRPRGRGGAQLPRVRVLAPRPFPAPSPTCSSDAPSTSGRARPVSPSSAAKTTELRTPARAIHEARADRWRH